MHEVYLLDALRTPIALSKKGLRRVKPEDMAAEVLKALWRRCCLERVDGIIGGNAVGTGGNLARLAALKAGLPQEIPACTVDMQCASGAAALGWGYAQIRAGLWDSCLAGGMESVSLQPLRVYASEDDRRSSTPAGDGAYRVAQFAPDELAADAMLQGAERVARAEGISRQELDNWALLSHQRAAAAARQGVFRADIMPVGDCREDEGIKRDMSEKLLARLPGLFGPGSLTTAGNACRTNDGAAFALLVSERWLASHPEHRPKARLLGAASGGGCPAESPRGAMRTADLLLSSQGLCYEDLSAIEFNEAFAVIDVLFARAHKGLEELYNRFGGALAYGHPYGASGCILLIQLLRSLEQAQGRLGLLAVAGAGGMGEAILLERCV